MSFSVVEAIQILERTPAVLRSMLGGLPQPWIMCDEGRETFSPFENVAHLIRGERSDWIARARKIFEQAENRRFDSFDRFAHRTESAGKSMASLLDEFENLRGSNLAILRSWPIGERELDLQGEHPDFGRVTLRQLLATWVAHDLGHIAQIARVMAKRYRDDVGPWKAYLPVLTR
jgi:hypothetical protein